ncbi:TPM domain-containing protein [Belliella marina]|uniref:TPM domain-containing protein n=1 Tax=Belliella marina TaxID=1644146 RepID=A0ABW4VIX6_9BACT
MKNLLSFFIILKTSVAQPIVIDPDGIHVALIKKRNFNVKMKIGTKIIILFLALNLLSCKGSTVEKESEIAPLELSGNQITSFPLPIGNLNDFGQILTDLQRDELSKILHDYEVETTRHIVLVTINSITPYKSVQKYTTDLGGHWGVGTSEENNGLVLVVCNSCREIGIATGIGTELVLTDEICKDVIERVMIPEFKDGEFFIGLKKGLAELMEKWN